jgi:hypothetical protein
LKYEGIIANQKQEGKSANQDNTLEVGIKNERVEREVEGKLPPFFSYFLLFSYMVLLQ